MSQENNVQVPQASIVAPTTGYVAPKNTLATVGVHGIAEAAMRDEKMFSLLVDTSKHNSFTNKKGDVETIVKMSGVEVGEYTVNMVVKRANPAQAKAKQEKNIADKLKKFARGKATDADIIYLLSHGFAGDDGKLDEGKCESVYADILAKQAGEDMSKAFKKMAENNGSLQANAAKA